jgi:hypothetical protein
MNILLPHQHAHDVPGEAWQYLPRGHVRHTATDALYTAPNVPAGHTQATTDTEPAGLTLGAGHGTAAEAVGQ